MASFCDKHTLGIPLYLGNAKEILANYGNDIEKIAYGLSGQHVYCNQIETKVCGVSGKALLYYGPWNHVNLCSDISKRINFIEEELKSLKRHPKSKLKRYSKSFNILKSEYE